MFMYIPCDFHAISPAGFCQFLLGNDFLRPSDPIHPVSEGRREGGTMGEEGGREEEREREREGEREGERGKREGKKVDRLIKDRGYIINGSEYEYSSTYSLNEVEALGIVHPLNISPVNSLPAHTCI